MNMFHVVLGLCAFALVLALGKCFLNAGSRWENGERWEIPPHR